MGKKILMLFVCTMLSASMALAQTRTVKGTVVDSETGEPIPGAKVMVQGTKMGAVADSKGTFVLSNLPKDAKKVIVSFMGMKTADVAIHDGGRVEAHRGKAGGTAKVQSNNSSGADEHGAAPAAVDRKGPVAGRDVVGNGCVQDRQKLDGP